MNNLFQSAAVEKLKERIDHLLPDSKPGWGQMNAAQMLAHCSEGLKNALAQTTPPRMWSGYLIALFFKKQYYSNQPFSVKNLKTAPSFKISSPKNLEYERKKLKELIELFHQEGRERCQKARHPILGKFTPEQWAIGQYKHIDYHLRQFGI